MKFHKVNPFVKIQQNICSTKHKIRNPKHLMNSAFYEFFKFENLRIEKQRLEQ